MYTLNQLKRNFTNFLVLNFSEKLSQVGPTIKNAEKLEKQQPKSPDQVAKENKEKIYSKTEKFSKFLNKEKLKYTLSLPDGDKYKYSLESIIEQVKNPEQKESKESNEKEKKVSRKEILKVLDSRIEKTLPKGQSIDKIAKILKKPDGTKFQNKDEAKDFLREQFLKGEIHELNKKVIETKNGEKISKKEKFLKENPELKKLDGKLLEEAMVVYGEKSMKKVKKILDLAEKNGEKIPDNLEDFNDFLTTKLSQLDKIYTKEQQKQIKQELAKNPDYLAKVLENKIPDNLKTDKINNSKATKNGNIGNEVIGSGVSSYIRNSYGGYERAPGTVSNIEISGKGDKLLLDFIAKFESNGDYNAIYPSSKVDVDLSKMTIKEVIAYQRRYKKQKGTITAAIGRYQFLASTMEGMIKNGLIDGNTLFTPETQDKLAILKLNQRGLQKFKSGALSRDGFQKQLSMEWDSIPMPNSNLSYAGHHTRISSKQVAEILDAVKSGKEYNSKASSVDDPNNISELNREKVENFKNSKNSKILEFRHGMVEKQLDKINESEIKSVDSVFVFRSGKQRDDLSGNEMKMISDKLLSINPKLKIFVDQEGGKVTRFKDFDNISQRNEFVEKALENTGISNKEIIRDKIYKLIGNSKHFPSLARLGGAYFRMGPGESNIKNDFLKVITYLRLDTLKERGVNTYGLVTDLDYGNRAISGKIERSFGKDEKAYEKFGKAMIDNANKLGMTIYLKHFPGHGAGNVDSHKGILNYGSAQKTYLEKNINLFEKLIDYGKGKVGLMVGHMFIPNEFKSKFENVINKAAYVLTDDLGMEGYKLGTGRKIPGKFFTTDLLNGEKIIKVDKKHTKTVL